MPDDASRHPRFNHVALSLPADALDARHRSEILDFYGEVFGWEEMPTMTVDRERLVLKAHSFEEFVFLVADESPMTCARLDHFGMSVATPEILEALYEKARSYRERDARVEIVERTTEDHGVLRLHSFYVRYLLPMMVEVQCFEWQG